VLGLSAVALALSGYLGWHFLADGSVVGCGVGSGCDAVLGSRWSSIGGVLPVSGLAAGVYLAVLLASFSLGPDTEASVRRLAWHALLLLTGAAAGSAVWFIAVQKWIVGAFCPYCMATHTVGLLLAALVIWQAPKQFHSDAPNTVTPPNAVLPSVVIPAPPLVMGARPALGLASFGFALAGILAVCQIVLVPPSVSRVGAAPEAALPALDPRAGPLLGPPDASHVITLLFDYNCPHCQQLHALLEEMVSRYHGQLAFALCPTPLDIIPRQTDAFKDSCELAQLALAVWVAKREVFPEFNRWMFASEPGRLWHPRELATAKVKAAELVGSEKLDAARADPWVARELQACIRLFGATGADAVPKLILGPHWVTALPHDVDDLISILQSNLDLPAPVGIK
jgi:uncharacterized membrane protein/protein-disulfide isomerase